MACSVGRICILEEWVVRSMFVVGFWIVLVSVAQSVEPRIVIPVVVGSNPIAHPFFVTLGHTSEVFFSWAWVRFCWVIRKSVDLRVNIMQDGHMELCRVV